MPKKGCNDLAASCPFVQLLMHCERSTGLHYALRVTRAGPALEVGHLSLDTASQKVSATLQVSMLVRRRPSLSRGRGTSAGTLLVSCPVDGHKAFLSTALCCCMLHLYAESMCRLLEARPLFTPASSG